MKHKTQDPKFYIENDRLVGQSGPVPEDEPLFILRARDFFAASTLKSYLDTLQRSSGDYEHCAAVCLRIRDFLKFQHEHGDRMKNPDTSIKDMHDGKPE